jgi:hypothetical protein
VLVRNEKNIMFLVFSDSPATSQAAAIFIHNDTLSEQRRNLSKPIFSSVDFMVAGNVGPRSARTRLANPRNIHIYSRYITQNYSIFRLSQ